MWVVGNAPTALFELIERPPVHPAIVIGLPVGFVGAADAKAALAAPRAALHHQPTASVAAARLRRPPSTR